MSFSLFENNYIRLLSIIFSYFFVIKFTHHGLIFFIEKIKNNENLKYLYVFLSSFRLPFIYLLSFLYLYILFDILFIEFNNEHFFKYKNVLLGSLNYFIILIISWTAFRISHRMKEMTIKDYMLQYKKFSSDNKEKILRTKQKTTNIEALFKIINVSILLTTVIVIVNQITGSTSGLLAFGGGLGIVFGLSARDFLSNFFGGIMIYMNRPFDIGDMIKSPDRNIEGVVHEIGWTAVKLETLDKRPLFVPNSLWSSTSIENLSRMKNRRINEKLKVKVDNFDNIAIICKNIKTILQEHSGIDQEQKNFIHLDHISQNYFELNLNCFTKTIELERYHSIKHDIFNKIYKIVIDNEGNFSQESYYININN